MPSEIELTETGPQAGKFCRLFVVVVVVVLRPSPNTKVHMGLSLPAVLPRTQ